MNEAECDMSKMMSASLFLKTINFHRTEVTDKIACYICEISLVEIPPKSETRKSHLKRSRMNFVSFLCHACDG